MDNDAPDIPLAGGEIKFIRFFRMQSEKLRTEITSEVEKSFAESKKDKEKSSVVIK